MFFFFFWVFGGTFFLTSDTKYNQQMVPSSKKTIDAASSHNHKELLHHESLFDSLQKKERKKEQMERKMKEADGEVSTITVNLSKGHRGQAVTMREGKMRRQRTKKPLAHTFPPGFKHGSEPWCTGGAGRKKRKKVKQTVGKRGRPVCPRLALIGRNKGSVHPKLLSIWDMAHRSARITFLSLWDASSEKWQQRKSVCLWCGCDNPCWQPEQRSRSMKRWRSAGDGGGKLEQMCGVKSRSPLEQEHEGLFVTQSTLQSCDGSAHRKCYVLFFLLPLINFREGANVAVKICLMFCHYNVTLVLKVHLFTYFVCCTLKTH